MKLRKNSLWLVPVYALLVCIVFVMLKFILLKSIMFYDLWKDQENIQYILSDNPSAEEKKQVDDFKSKLLIRNAINQTALLHPYENEVQREIDELYKVLSARPNLTEMQKLSLDFYYTLYGTCCLATRDMTNGYNALKAMIAYKPSGPELDEYRLQTIYRGFQWVGLGFRYRPRWDNSSIAKMAMNFVLYGVGFDSHHRTDSFRSKENKIQLIEAAYDFMLDANKNYAAQKEVQANKFLADYYALWLIGASYQRGFFSPDKCKVRLYRLLDALGRDFFATKDIALKYLKSNTPKTHYEYMQSFSEKPYIFLYREDCLNYEKKGFDIGEGW